MRKPAGTGADPADAPAAGARFPAICRVRRKREFDLAYQEGARASGASLVVTGRANQAGFARLGLSVGRRTGNAVVRNRWKRRIRAAFARSAAVRTRGVDLVVSVKSHSAEPPFRELEAELARAAASLLRRLARQ